MGGGAAEALLPAAPAPRAHPLLAAAGAVHADGAWRVSAAALAAAQAAQPLLGEQRLFVSRYCPTSRPCVTVHWASSAALKAWNTDDLGGLGDALSAVVEGSGALVSIFGAVAQSCARGDAFHHVIALQGGEALQRLRFTPLDLEEAQPAESGILPGASQRFACASRGRLTRCVLDEVLPADEVSPEHERLVQRALFADRYSSSPLTVVALASCEVLHQNPASMCWHGSLPRGGVAGAAWLTSALLGGDAAALAAALADVAAERVVQLRARVTCHGGQLAGNAVARWHEVAFTPGVDPVTLEAVMVVTESDISCLKAAEVELARLHAAQLAELTRSEAALESLICSCFPEQVASELLENLVAAREVKDREAAARPPSAPTGGQQHQRSPLVARTKSEMALPAQLGLSRQRSGGVKAYFAADDAAVAAAAAKRPITAPAAFAEADSAAAAKRPITAPAAFAGAGKPRRGSQLGRSSSAPEPPGFTDDPPALMSAPRCVMPFARHLSLLHSPQRASQPFAAADDVAALLLRLHAGGALDRVAARRHACVTVVFTDIKGFTALSSQADPFDVMTMLHELFVIFDALADKFGLHKLETVGDAYVAVIGDGIGAAGGGSTAACAAAAVEFGAACAAAAGRVATPTAPGSTHDGGGVSIRVGAHSGPAMSGIVGTKMPRWALFGDTMNLAARLESTGLPGRVQVSAPTRALADAAGPAPFAWRRRGEVEMKGKGRVSCFLLRASPKGGVCAVEEGEEGGL